MTPKTIFATLWSTALLGLIYFLLSCVYQFFTTNGAQPEHIFDIQAWHHTSRTAVFGLTATILFIGIAIAVIGNVFRISDNRKSSKPQPNQPIEWP